MKGTEGVMNSTLDERPVSTEYLIALIVFKSFGTLLGVSGNLLVILHNVFLRYEKTPQTFLIINLAISDLLACLTIYPLRIGKSMMMLTRSGKKNATLCQINNISGCFSVSLSVLTLLAVTYDRYLSIKRPLRYPMLMTKGKVYGIIFAIWLTASIYLPIAVTYVETSDTNSNNRCMFGKVGLSVLLLLYIYVPIIFIFLFNFKTWRIAQTQRRSIARNSVVDSSAKNVNFSTRVAKELKAVKTLAMVMGVLVLCFTPFAVTIIFEILKFDAGIPPIFNDLFADLVGINSVCNPLIYSIRNKEYRKAIRRFFARLCC